MEKVPHIQIGAKSAVNPTGIDTTQISRGLKTIGNKLGAIQDSRDKIKINMMMREESKSYMNQARTTNDYSPESLNSRSDEFVKELNEEFTSPTMQTYITDVGDRTKQDLEIMLGTEYSQKVYQEGVESLEINHSGMTREEINLNTESIVEQSQTNFEAGFITLEQHQRSRVLAKGNALNFNITDDLSRIIPDLDNITDSQIKVMNSYVEEVSTSDGKIVRGGIGNEDIKGLVNPYIKAVNNRKVEANFGFTGDVNADLIRKKDWDMVRSDMSVEEKKSYDKQSKLVQDRYDKYNSSNRVDFATGQGSVIPERGAPSNKSFDALFDFSIRTDFNVDPSTLSENEKRIAKDRVMYKIIDHDDDGQPIYYKDVAHGLDSTTREIIRQNTASMDIKQKVELANGIAGGTLDYYGNNINNFGFRDYIERNPEASNMLKTSLDESMGLNSVDHFVGDSGNERLIGLYSQVASTDLDSLKSEYARQNNGDSLTTNFNEAKRKNGWMKGTKMGALYNKLGELQNTGAEMKYFTELAKNIDETMMKAYSMGGHEALAGAISDSLDSKYTSVTIGGKTRTVDAKYNSIRNVENTLKSSKREIWTDRAEFLTYIGTDGKIRNVEGEGMIFEEFDGDSGRVNLIHKRTGQTIFDTSRKEDGSTSPVPLSLDLFIEQEKRRPASSIGVSGIEEFDVTQDYTTPFKL